MKAEMSKTFLNNLIRLQPDQSFRDTQKETFKEFQKPLISASNSTLSIKDIITPRPTKKQAQVFNFKNPYIALKRDSKADISKSNMKSPISQHTDFKKREGVKAQHLTNKSKNDKTSSYEVFKFRQSRSYRENRACVNVIMCLSEFIGMY